MKKVPSIAAARLRMALVVLFISSTVLLMAGMSIGAPERNLNTVQNGQTPAPKLQWSYYGPFGYEFYDNAAGQSAQTEPWGGAAGTNAIKGVVTDIWYDNGGIMGFYILAEITNDLYNYTGILDNTIGSNDHNQSAPNISGQVGTTMLDVMLALSFADDETPGNLPISLPFGQESNIFTYPEDLAWYSYSAFDPPDYDMDGGYYVPAFCFTNGNAACSGGTLDKICPGETHSLSIWFQPYQPILPTESEYDVIVNSKNYTQDIFSNRSSSLKISNYPDALCLDDGSAYPTAPLAASNVSVFYRAEGLTFAYNKVIEDHNWWNPPLDENNEMISLTLTANTNEQVRLQKITVKASGTGNDGNDTEIQNVKVYLDNNWDGIVNEGDELLGTGDYDSDEDTLEITLTTQPVISPWSQIPLVICYVMGSNPPVGNTYEFAITTALVKVEGAEETIPALGLPLASATKTVVEKSLNFKTHISIPDHYWHPSPDPYNEMISLKVSADSNVDLKWESISLEAFGSGHDVEDIEINGVQVWRDGTYFWNPPIGDGIVNPDFPSYDYLLGSYIYNADNGTTTIQIAPDYQPTIPAGGSIYAVICYVMKSTAPVGDTYGFAITDATGKEAVSENPIPVTGLPLESSTKTVEQTPAPPLNFAYNVNAIILNHNWYPSQDQYNEMVSLTVSAPESEEDVIWNTVTLTASGSGNDDEDIEIDEIRVYQDFYNIGVVDEGEWLLGTGDYNGDNGTANITLTAPPTIPANLSINAIICYVMKPTAPVGAKYKFTMGAATGTGWTSELPASVTGLPLESAEKTVVQAPIPPLNFAYQIIIPPHNWHPNPDQYNEMISLKLSAPGAQENVRWNAVTLKASGSGNDDEDIEIDEIRVYQDFSNIGVVDAGEPLLGTGDYVGDNGTANITLTAPPTIPANGSIYVIICYVMKSTAPVGAKYKFTVESATGTGVVTGLAASVTGLPLDSAIKTVVGPPPVVSIGEAKKYHNIGDEVQFTGKVVTYFDGYYGYIQEENRFAGIRIVYGSGEWPNIGDRVSAIGTLDVLDSEALLVNANIFDRITPGNDARPICAAARSIGGLEFGIQPAIPTPEPAYCPAYGLNNVGLLARVTGKVGACVSDDSAGYYWFTIDDGSGVKTSYLDWESNLQTVDGLKILADPWFYPLYPNDIVCATGISSVDTTFTLTDTLYQRMIRPRDIYTDIQFLASVGSL
ncbi:MAG: hypothetical protein Q7N50_13595 [Armatimonadota bacterium]|nr:hypothetical protein [Armatimonadota bacterium]